METMILIGWYEDKIVHELRGRNYYAKRGRNCPLKKRGQNCPRINVPKLSVEIVRKKNCEKNYED